MKTVPNKTDRMMLTTHVYRVNILDKQRFVKYLTPTLFFIAAYQNNRSFPHASPNRVTGVEKGLKIKSKGIKIKAELLKIKSKGIKIKSKGIKIKAELLKIKSKGLKIKSKGIKIKAELLKIKMRFLKIMAKKLLSKLNRNMLMEKQGGLSSQRYMEI